MKRYEGSPAVVIERRKGTPDSPFSNMNETLVVTGDGKVLLSEIPNELNRVIVTSEDNVTWYEITEGQIPENGFKVDYINKLVTFNTIHVGKQLHFKYLGEGNHYYSVHTIYTKLEDKSVVETLGDIVEGGKDALDALEALNEKLEEVTQATNNAVVATNEAQDMILEGNQVIDVANNKITEIDSKITEATTKISELDLELDEAKITVSDVKQQSAIVEDIITDGQNTIENANLVINEIKSVGEFNLTTFYKKNNTVLDNGSTWIALQDTQNNPLPTLPATENSNWRLASLHGAKGEKGDTGAALSILGKLTDVSQLPPSGHSGDAYTINGELYVWSDNANAWENVGNIKGEKGDKGTIGDEGKSAYEVAIINGFVGTELEWLSTLKGEKGDTPDLSDINDQISEIQEMIEQGGLYENIEPLEATNAPADYPLGESFFANTSPNIASWQTALNVDTTFTRLFVITRIDKNRLHAFQDIIIASDTETKRFTRYNLNDVWLGARELGGSVIKPYGVEVINENHAIRRFEPYNEWKNNTLPELLYIVFNHDRLEIEGEFRVRATTPKGTGGKLFGSFESMTTIRQFNTDTSPFATNTDNGVLRTSDGFANQFYCSGAIGVTPTDPFNLRPYISFVKILTPNELNIEIELFTANGKAKEILESIEFLHNDTTYTTPWSLPRQKSIFERAKTALVEGDRSYTAYVSPHGNDLTAVLSDTGRAFKTIQAAINALPKYSNINNNVTVFPGTYEETVSVNGFTGSGTLTIRGADSINNAQGYKVRGFVVTGCSARIAIQGLHLNNAGVAGVQAFHSQLVAISSCDFNAGSTGQNGVLSSGSKVYLSSSIISNRSHAMVCEYTGTLYSTTNTGTGNINALTATTGGTIIKYSTQPSGTNLENASSGGLIRS